MYKSTLSPLSMSKLYWTIVIPRLLYGAEIRIFDAKEIIEYEKFHVSMAKEIQGLSQNSPNPAALLMLGWRDIASTVEYIKLCFIQRVVSLDASCIYRSVFIRRFFYILYTGFRQCSGPVSVIVMLCVKYCILEEVLSVIRDGLIPEKRKWKNFVANAVNDRNHSKIRFKIKLYTKLHIFRSVVLTCKAVCWWDIAKELPYLKHVCIVMVKLLCGTSVLASYKNVTVPKLERVCKCCGQGVVEDLHHFVFSCPSFEEYRFNMFTSIMEGLSINGQGLWRNLSEYIKLYLLMGMDYPLSHVDICHVRIQSCIWLHKAYTKRLIFENN